MQELQIEDKKLLLFRNSRIAICYYNAGLGHLREALAVKDILRPYCHVELIDIGLYAHGTLKSIGIFYETLQRSQFYNGLFNFIALSWWKNPPNFLLKTLNKLQRRKENQLTHALESILANKKIDFVVTTHFFAAGALFYSNYYNSRSVNIVVDNLWKNTAWIYAVDNMTTIVPTIESEKNVYNRGVYGLKKDKIILAGHPFPAVLFSKRKEIFKRRTKEYLSSNPLRILVTTGGAGTNYKEMSDIMKGGSKLIKSKKIRLILWCNHHKWLAEKLKTDAFKLNLIQNNFLEVLFTKDRIQAVQGLHNKILESDLLVTKPGELALYGGIIPLIFFRPTSPQEHSLADFGYLWNYAISGWKIETKNLLNYANTHRNELIQLDVNGQKNPLIKLQDNNIILKTIINEYYNTQSG